MDFILANLDWLAASCELLASWLIGNKHRIGFILNIIGNVTWIYVALTRGIPGLLLVVVPAIGINAWNWYKWRKSARESAFLKVRDGLRRAIEYTQKENT